MFNYSIVIIVACQSNLFCLTLLLDHNGNKCLHFLVPSMYSNVFTPMFYTTVCTLFYWINSNQIKLKSNRYSFRIFPEISQHNFNVERMAALLYSRRLTMSHEAHPSASFVSGVGKLCPRPRAIADDESRITAEHVICFRGMQTVPVSARNELLTPPQRIVTQIIRDISRCPHGPVVSKFYCPGPYFYLPRDIRTCLSLSPEAAWKIG